MEQYSYVNANTINDILINGSNYDSNKDIREDPSKRCQINLTKSIDWSKDVYAYRVLKTTSEMCHYIVDLLGNIFCDVESAMIYPNTYNNDKKGCIVEVYFKYNARKTNENDLLAFTTVSNVINKNRTGDSITNQVVDQIMISRNKKRNDAVITKEAKEMFSDFVITEPGQTRDPNWINKYDWDKYIQVVNSNSDAGILIRFTGFDIDKLFRLLINGTRKDTDENGNDVYRVNDKYMVAVEYTNMRLLTRPSEIYYNIFISPIEKYDEVYKNTNPTSSGVTIERFGRR